jgi:predicted nucleic acid-binding protein
MRFLDTNVFIYAYYKPKRELTDKEKRMKEEAKRIISGLSEGKEEMATTVVHLSEMVNILKHGMSPRELTNFVLSLYSLDNLKICGVSETEYFAATELAADLKMDPNDALAVDFMKRNRIEEIYTFDKNFEGKEGIKRLP